MALYEKLQQAKSEEDIKAAYLTLTDKLRPQVYTLGFLKE